MLERLLPRERTPPWDVLPWPPLIHPIWRMAGDALAQPIAASISVNRDLTVLALVRLITAASTFWVAVQLCRNGARAQFLIQSIAVIACVYSVYGLVVFAAETGRLPWLEMPSSSSGSLSSTFINHNSFATYAGLGLVAIAGLTFQLYRHEVNGMAGWRRLQLASLIEITGKSGAAPLAGGFVTLAALLLTGSRGGVIAAGHGANQGAMRLDCLLARSGDGDAVRLRRRSGGRPRRPRHL